MDAAEERSRWHETRDAVRHIVCGRFVNDDEEDDGGQSPAPFMAPVQSFLDFLASKTQSSVSGDLLAGLENCVGEDARSVQSLGGRVFEEELTEKIRRREPLVLFLRNHNVALRITKPDEKGEAKVSAFPLQAPEDEVMKAVRLSANVPTVQVVAHESILSSDSFISQLVGLSTISPPDVIPSFEKEGSTFFLEHGTRNPKYATDFLLPVLAVASPNSSDQIHFQSVVKHIRDEVRLM